MTNDPTNPTDEEAQRLRRVRERAAVYIAQSEEARGQTAPTEFLAAPLQRWQRAQGLSRAAFAETLGGDAEGLDRLALCRPPRPERFAEDAAAVAAHCGLNPDRLLSLLRKMQVMAGFSAAGEASALPVAPVASRRAGFFSGDGLLVAARDRDDNATNDDSEDSPRIPPMTTTDEDVLRLAAALRRMTPKAEAIASQRSPSLTPVNPAAFWETHFPVACVAMPGLCLTAAVRYIARFADALPPGLQAMADAAGPGAGRPVRGACIAWRGMGLLLVDEADAEDEQRFSLMHEGAHFLLDHYLPRQEILRRLGPSAREVLDGKRPPSWGERFDATLRGVELVWHSHLYDRNAAHRTQAEDDADGLSCLLAMPPSEISAEIPPDEETDILARRFVLPSQIVQKYLSALRHDDATRKPPPANPLLRRFGLS